MDKLTCISYCYFAISTPLVKLLGYVNTHLKKTIICIELLQKIEVKKRLLSLLPEIPPPPISYVNLDRPGQLYNLMTLY